MKVLGIKSIVCNVTNVMIDLEEPPIVDFLVRITNGDGTITWTFDQQNGISKSTSDVLEAAYQDYMRKMENEVYKNHLEAQSK
jgi:hypothetical protein